MTNKSPDSARHRGRPQGTGKNDAAHLARIAKSLAADPSLTPTAAIRGLGIDDPSVIRRLRDKVAATSASPAKTAALQTRAPAKSTSRITAKALLRATKPAAPERAAVAAPVVAATPDHTTLAKAALEPSAEAPRSPSASPLNFATAALTSVSQMQANMLSLALRMSPVGIALKLHPMFRDQPNEPSPAKKTGPG